MGPVIILSFVFYMRLNLAQYSTESFVISLSLYLSGNISIKYMPDKLYDVLAEYVKTIRAPYLFPDKRGRPIPTGTISKTFKKVILRAGVDPTLLLHHARHTFGSNLMKLAKGDLKYVQERMSQKDPESTKGYLHALYSDDFHESGLDYGE